MHTHKLISAGVNFFCDFSATFQKIDSNSLQRMTVTKVHFSQLTCLIFFADPRGDMYSFAAAYELLCDVRDIIVSPRGRINPQRKFEIKYFTSLQSCLHEYCIKIGKCMEETICL